MSISSTELPTTKAVSDADRPRVTPRTAAVGLAMGAADIVPGVSGGTVALILGIYERLLAAITHFDATFVGMVRRGRFREAINHADLWFVTTLGGGVLAGAIGLAGVMDHLLTHHRSLTYAAFFGLIFASGVLVGRLAKPAGAARAWLCVGLGLGAALFAFWLMSLGRVTPIEGLPYTFASGAIAICAMILPGISGAYLLLMLGKYEEITGILKRLPRLDVTTSDVVMVAVFSAGCLVGLLLFSRLLRWLLARHWSATMAVLCGFMIGSLYRVWPWQRDATPDVEEFKRKVFEPFWPTEVDGGVIACVAVAVVAFVGVLAVDVFARRHDGSVEEHAHAAVD